MRQGTKGMNFKSYAERAATLKQPDEERNKKQIVQKRPQVSINEMKMTSVNKVEFASLNDKKYGWYCAFTLQASLAVKKTPDKKSLSKNSYS